MDNEKIYQELTEIKITLAEIKKDIKEHNNRVKNIEMDQKDLDKKFVKLIYSLIIGFGTVLAKESQSILKFLGVII